jgi:hypothetical protein
MNFMSSFLQLYLREVCLITFSMLFVQSSLWVWSLSGMAIVFITVFLLWKFSFLKLWSHMNLW